MWVLQFVRLHVLPQSLDDDWSGLGMDAQHASQSGIQLKLRRLQSAQDKITLKQNTLHLYALITLRVADSRGKLEMTSRLLIRRLSLCWAHYVITATPGGSYRFQQVLKRKPYWSASRNLELCSYHTHRPLFWLLVHHCFSRFFCAKDIWNTRITLIHFTSGP